MAQVISFEEKRLMMTIRLIYSIIAQTVIFVATVVGFYFALRSDIRDDKTRQEGINQLVEEKFKSQQLQNSILVKELEGTNIRVAQLEITLAQKKN